MLPERFPPDDPREWLNRARSNLLQATGLQPGVYPEDLCFLAQQAAEKALKALLLHLGIQFPYVHDLSTLLQLLEGSGLAVPPEIHEAARLSDYAVEARYPGLAEPVTPDEYQQALAHAQRVIAWVETNLH